MNNKQIEKFWKNISNMLIDQNTDSMEILKELIIFWETIWASDLHINNENIKTENPHFFIQYQIPSRYITILNSQAKNASWEDIFSKIKNKVFELAGLKEDKIHDSQDGQFSINVKNKNGWLEKIFLRVNTVPTSKWSKIAFRILRKEIKQIDELWFNPKILNIIKNTILNSLNGWYILVTWPTWSWKSTTLYALYN